MEEQITLNPVQICLFGAVGVTREGGIVSRTTSRSFRGGGGFGVAELSYESVRNRHFLKLQIMN